MQMCDYCRGRSDSFKLTHHLLSSVGGCKESDVSGQRHACSEQNARLAQRSRGKKNEVQGKNLDDVAPRRMIYTLRHTVINSVAFRFEGWVGTLRIVTRVSLSVLALGCLLFYM